MPYLNRVFLMGHVGREPEVMYTQYGTKVYRFSLAVNRRGRNSETDWFDITVFDSRGVKSWIEEIEKGDLVMVEGEIHINQGETRTFVDVIARRVMRLRSRSRPAIEESEEELIIEEEDLGGDEPPF